MVLPIFGKDCVLKKSEERTRFVFVVQNVYEGDRTITVQGEELYKAILASMSVPSSFYLFFVC